jgi:hypothetical protein
MIEVYKIYKGFMIRGHADFAPSGQDIVCSAVSALAQSVYTTLTKRQYAMTTRIESGNMQVVLHAPDWTSGAIMDVLFDGAEQIAKQYPDHVTYHKEELPY